MSINKQEKKDEVDVQDEMTKNELDLIVDEMIKIKPGRELMRFFIDEAIAYQVHPDPRIDAFNHGRRYYGLMIMQHVRLKYPNRLAEILTSGLGD